jgi:hypothetical protein
VLGVLSAEPAVLFNLELFLLLLLVSRRGVITPLAFLATERHYISHPLRPFSFHEAQKPPWLFCTPQTSGPGKLLDDVGD